MPMNSDTYGALAAKSRALYGKRLRMSDYDQMAAMRSTGEVLDYLSNHPAWSRTLRDKHFEIPSRIYVERALHDEIWAEYQSLNAFTLRGDKLALSFPVMQLELEEILMNLRRLAPQESWREDERAPARLFRTGKVDYKKLSSCTDYDGLLEATKKTVYYDALRDLRSPEGGLPDYTSAEILLRSTYYTTLFRAFRRHYGGQVQKAMLRGLGEKVDLQNLIHILRLKTYFPAERQYITSLYPFNYRLSPETIRRLCDAPDAEAALDIIGETRYGERFQGRTLRELEDFSLEISAKFNRQQLRASPPSIYTAISYLRLKQVELQAVIRLIESVKYQVPYDPFLAKLAGA